jgi:hypothetical protein
MLEICESFFEQKHPGPIIDSEEEKKEKEENDTTTLWNDFLEFYDGVKFFFEFFWFDTSYLEE